MTQKTSKYKYKVLIQFFFVPKDLKLTSLVMTFLSISRFDVLTKERNGFYKSPSAGDQFYSLNSSTLIFYEKIFPPRIDVPSIWTSLILENNAKILIVVYVHRDTKWEIQNVRITPGRHFLMKNVSEHSYKIWPKTTLMSQHYSITFL